MIEGFPINAFSPSFKSKYSKGLEPKHQLYQKAPLH